jgi:hypothetical protein
MFQNFVNLIEMSSEMFSGFEERDIFNVDEGELLFKIMLDKTLALKGDGCQSGRNQRRG